MNHPRPVISTHKHVVRVRLSNNGSVMRKVLPLRSSSAAIAYARLEKFVRGAGAFAFDFLRRTGAAGQDGFSKQSVRLQPFPVILNQGDDDKFVYPLLA